MSTRVIWDGAEEVAALYDSVSGIAFGQVFTGLLCYDRAEEFLEWLREEKLDPRAMSKRDLRDARDRFDEEHPQEFA